MPEGGIFHCTPSQGTLQPTGNVLLDFSFAPREAAPYNGTAICSISGIARAINLRGSAKFPYLTTDIQVVSFGDVLVGRSGEQTVLLRNLSPVKTAFKVNRVESDCDAQFTFAIINGRLNPYEELPVKIAFSATTSGVYSSDTYEISTPAGTTTTLRCSGNAVGPALGVSQSSVNFGSLQIGATAKRSFTLVNNSESPAYFQFCTPDPSDGGADPAFAVEPIRGLVPARASLPITVTLQPRGSMGFYRRLVCLVRAGIPLWVDLIATAYDESSRPPPLAQRHVDRYYARRISTEGHTIQPPEVLEVIEKEKDGEEDLSPGVMAEIANTDPWETFFYEYKHFLELDTDESMFIIFIFCYLFDQGRQELELDCLVSRKLRFWKVLWILGPVRSGMWREGTDCPKLIPKSSESSTAPTAK